MQGQANNENLKNQSSDYIIFYIIGTINALFHIAVGIVWQVVSLPKGKSPLLALPYFGGYLILIGVALILAFVYFFLQLRMEPHTPINLRRFYLIVLIIVSLANLALLVMMSIRVGDYYNQKDSIIKRDYYGVVFISIVDIVLTFFFFPSNIYLIICKFHKIKAQAQRIQNQQQEDNRGQGQNNINQQGVGLDRQIQTNRHLRRQEIEGFRGQRNIEQRDNNNQPKTTSSEGEGIQQQQQKTNKSNEQNRPQIYNFNSNYNPGITLDENIMQTLKSQDRLNGLKSTNHTQNNMLQPKQKSRRKKTINFINNQGRAVIVNIKFTDHHQQDTLRE